MKRQKKYVKGAILLSLSLLAACNSDANGTEQSTAAGSSDSTEEVSAAISELVTYGDDDFYSDWENENPAYIELNGTDVDFDASAPLVFADGVLTIKAGGVYVLSGELDDGQIVIDAEDNIAVRLVLNGAAISSSTSAAIYVVQAEKTIISLPEGTENMISDGEQYVYEDSSTDEPNAAIYSKDDLTINGSGTLIVNGNYNNGITSKDDLKITGGDISITAADDGLMGRDLVAVNDGTITIESSGDGIKSTNDKDATVGMIILEGGTFEITAESDGIQAVNSLIVTDGEYTIVTGGGSPETISNNDGMMGGPGNRNTTSSDTDEESASTKGLKAETEVTITGGTFAIDSLDDTVHSNGDITITGGDLTLASGDDGIHADEDVTMTDGAVTVVKSYEGIEGNNITLEGGTIDVTASDDGINVAGGNDESGMDIEAASEGRMLTITGGTIYVNADGDGIDSNGSISMSDGLVIVNGPTANMDGALDYDSSFDITGGTIIAAGSSGMAQAASDESAQPSIMMTYSETQAAGTLVHLEDSEGNTIVTFAPEKTYQSIFISSPSLTTGSSYTLYSGGSATGTAVNGLYADGSYEGGTEIVTFELTDSVTWLNESGVTTGRSSGPGGGNPGEGGMRPDGEGSNPGEGGMPPEGEGEMPMEGEGQTPPDRGGNFGNMFDDLDEETRAEVEAIMEEARAGTITQEEMQQRLEELGVEFPGNGGMPGGREGDN
ncbi:protein of unknown function [Evansella caseinilytica]|uniref:Carbohydrate-binding domain-containing protein n=1 Tax=Evansella caseinilytica TaxID=1503961 RepID=A0A1H3RKK7_9BACI|nr:carbohydrate-binding domain-containing protein [Evansella caseinilytica]SDZ26284.1 protein of unknown function [Evansella caseinilytica]